MSRNYHNLTSHYNLYFNGHESLKSGLSKINSSIENDYTKLLPIYKSSEAGTENIASSDMDIAIEKAMKLISIHSITAKPKKRNKSKIEDKEEFNNWVDDSYLLIGQAYFYQKNYTAAIENFTKVIRNFSEEDSKYEAYVWLVRCYTDAERYSDALDAIEEIDATESFPSQLDDDFSLAAADYYIKINNHEQAIPYMKAAIANTHNKKNKIRYTYILAQLYGETGNDQMAMETYQSIIHMNPEYETAFNARISTTESYSGDMDSEKLIKELRKMLNDSKNEEFQDQIYYALGNIYFSEGSKSLSVDNYQKSVSKSIYNDYQRALSCLTLADIYFSDEEYMDAQCYYDSAMIVISTDYPDYESIEEKYINLTSLTDNLYTVEREDSLQQIAQMSETERNARIEKWIQDARDEELRQQQAEAAALSNQTYASINQSQLGSSQSSSESNWYFYNPTTVTYGKTEFKQQWGERKLEDNWRRQNNSPAIFDTEEESSNEDELAAENVLEEQKTDDQFSSEYYMQDLPLTEEEMAKSHAKIRDALFNAGRIFEEDFNDYENSIECYEDLLNRYKKNKYHLITCFNLWNLYNQIGDLEQSSYYKNLVISEYPGSKYAKYLVNPDYFIELEAFNDSIDNLYKEAYNNYKLGQYAAAETIASQVLSMNPDSLIESKAAFIQTISQGTQTDIDSFAKKLETYIETYPESSTKPLAENIYQLIQDSTLVNYQQLVEMGYLNSEIQNEEVLLDEQAETDEFGGKFSYDKDLLHYFVITYPRTANVDVNRLKFDIANYNIDHYTKMDFDIESENLNSKTGILLVRSLNNKDQSLIYFRSIIRNREVFETLSGVDYTNFVISSTNYREVLADKNTTDYLKFFIKNYSRFIGSDFPEDEIPEPEELMAQAEEKENKFEEHGTYVIVKTEEELAGYKKNTDAQQYFVIAIQNTEFDMHKITDDFISYNNTEFENSGLTVDQSSFGDYKLLIVKEFTTTNEAVVYFRQTVATRSLFSELDTLNYRNFIISDENLKHLNEEKDMDTYMDFFKKNYLNSSQSTQVSSPAKTIVKETTPSTETVVEEVAEPVAVEPIVKESENTEAQVPEQESTEPVIPEPENTEPIITEPTVVEPTIVEPVVEEPIDTEPAYEGPYNIETSGTHSFILIVPLAEVNPENIKNSIDLYNSQNYASMNLQTSQVSFDTENILFKVTGFKGKDSGMSYLRSIVKSDDVYGSLSEINYRNFIISEINYPVFLENKNITEYLHIYKTYYINQ